MSADVNHLWATESRRHSNMQPNQKNDPTHKSTSCEVPVQVEFVLLRTLEAGPLLRWLGPALRGLVVLPLRDHFCHLMGGYEATPFESTATSNVYSIDKVQNRSSHSNKYCSGCRKNAVCPYGTVFEPDMRIIRPENLRDLRGANDGLRGITIGPQLLDPAAFEPLAEDESTVCDQSRRGSPLADFMKRTHASDIEDRPNCNHNANGLPSRLHDCNSSRFAAPAGTPIIVRILSIGQTAIDLSPLVIEALDGYGRISGLGSLHRVRFMVEPTGGKVVSWQLNGDTLPTTLCGGVIPWLRIVLDSPLSLKRRQTPSPARPAVGRHRRQPSAHPAHPNNPNGRSASFLDSNGIAQRLIESLNRPSMPQPNQSESHSNPGDLSDGNAAVRKDYRTYSAARQEHPTYHDLFSDSVRTVRRAISEFASPDYLSGVHLGEFLQSAHWVETESTSLEFFEQTRTSARQESRRSQSGWLGAITFRNVPLSHLPWLVWSGRLGTGDSRNCGAGLWHLEIG